MSSPARPVLSRTSGDIERRCPSCNRSFDYPGLCHGVVSKKLDHEFSRANLTEEESQRLKVFYYGGPARDGAALLTASEVYGLDRVTSGMFEDWWVKILKVSRKHRQSADWNSMSRCLSRRQGGKSRLLIFE